MTYNTHAAAVGPTTAIWNNLWPFVNYSSCPTAGMATWPVRACMFTLQLCLAACCLHTSY